MRPWLAATLVFAMVVVSGLRPDAARAEGAAEVEVVTTPLGLTAYLIRSAAVPFLSVSLEFKGGSSLDPEGKAGLANMVSGLLDEGAGDLDSQAFRAELEDRAIRLSFDAGKDGFSGSLKVLTRERERAFELLRLALTAPRFDAEPVERIRSQIVTGLIRRDEDPQYIAGRTWFERAFAGHPYASPGQGTPESVATIDTDDLRRFVAERLARDNLYIGVAGDITAEELAPLLDQTFGALPANAAPWGIADVAPEASGVLVERKAVPQSAVVFGQEGLAREDPDYYAAYTANYILGGGGFSSRLTEEVREKRGLAYSIYSQLEPLDHAPIWVGGVGTSNASVGQTIELIRAEVGRMAAGEISQADLDDAKTYLIGSFPLRLTSNDQIARTLTGMQLADLGPDYLAERNGFIEAVTLEDLKRTAARIYDPDRLLFVVAGEPDGLQG